MKVGHYELLRLRKYVSNNKHCYHIVTRSPWPFFAAIGALELTMGLVMYSHLYKRGFLIFLMGICHILGVMFG